MPLKDCSETKSVLSKCFEECVDNDREEYCSERYFIKQFHDEYCSKKKDAMYTKYWLSHKHPDFRRPYVFKVDSDDLIGHLRSTLEGLRQRQIEQDISDTATERERRRNEEAQKGAAAFLDKWRTVLNKPNEYEAQRLFEQWRKEYEKSGKRPPKIKKPKESDLPSM